MTMLFIGSHATRTCSGDSQRGIFISPRYQLMTGIIYPGKRQFKRAIPACHGQKPWARHGQRKLAATSNVSTISQEVANTSANQIEQQIAAIDKQLSSLSSSSSTDSMNHETEISQLKKQREALQKQLQSIKDSSSSSNAGNVSQAQNANEQQPTTKEEADSMKTFGRAAEANISPQSYTAMKNEQDTTSQQKEQQLVKRMTL